jgi:hypothetical protein
MLDLDSLAEKRARSLDEHVERWQDAVWSADFQKAAQNMSDGEVESLLAGCPSLGHFNAVVSFIAQHPETGQLSPFGVVRRAADERGCSLSEWIAALPVTSSNSK